MVVDFTSEKKKRLGNIYVIGFDPDINPDDMSDADWLLLLHPDGTVEINRFGLKLHLQQLHNLKLKEIIYWDKNDTA
jgi:hypothetical protein